MKLSQHWIALTLLAALVLSACSGAALPATGGQAGAASTTAALAAGQAAQTTAVPTSTGQAQAASQAPVCTAPAALTKPLTEGPYFKAGSPERTSLLDGGITGTKLTITGYVLTADCKPVAHALLDFWQANAQGQYDNSGYTLRGHQNTDAHGHYQLETIVPGLYPGRTEHIHVKVQAPNGPVLTTQLFFPDQASNQSDQIFDPSLVLPVQNVSGGLAAAFNFVVSAQ